MQEWGCAALCSMCWGTDATALARKQRTVEAGGRGAAADATQAHTGDAEMQRLGQKVVNLIHE